MTETRPVALTQPTMHILRNFSEVPGFEPETTAAIGAAMVRSRERPGTNAMIYDTVMTYDEIAQVWALLQTFVDSDPASRTGSDRESQETLMWIMGGVQSDMESLMKVAAAMQAEQPKRRRWFGR